MWHHIDACWGGSLIFADNFRGLDGCERAHSIATNLHKGFGIPNQAAMLITNGKENALRKANTSGADYLFHETEYSKYDIGDKTLSCGRKPDGLKIWLYMKKHGLDGFRKIANEALEKAATMTQLVKDMPDKFEMINEPMGTNVCFSYT